MSFESEPEPRDNSVKVKRTEGIAQVPSSPKDIAIMRRELSVMKTMMSEWCNKWDKYYLTMFVMGGSTYHSISNDDADYDSLGDF